MESYPAVKGHYRKELTRCNKSGCKKCAQGKGHGPYLYFYFREGGKLRKKYIGKKDIPLRQESTENTIYLEDVLQICPLCRKNLGGDLSELAGYNGLIYHKACRDSQEIRRILQVILESLNKGHEPLVGEVAEQVGLKRKEISALLKEKDIRYRRTYRKDQQGRYFTKDLKSKIEETLQKCI